MHTHGSGGRRRGKPRSRILYWFRTPPGVRIGRSALDEDAIRLIEQHNPDVEFDWTRILKSQDGTGGPTPGTGGQTPGARTSGQPERRRRPRVEDVPFTPPAEESAAPAIEAAPETEELEEVGPAIEEPSVADIDLLVADAQSVDAIEPADLAVVEEFLVEPRVEPPPPRPQAGDALSSVESRLGSEGLSRLRARYAEVLARISEAVADQARQEELKATAERLNPDTWVTDEEVSAGLEHYESVFESLRSVVGRRRKRGRRRGERRRTTHDQPGPDESDPGEQQ